MRNSILMAWEYLIQEQRPIKLRMIPLEIEDELITHASNEIQRILSDMNSCELVPSSGKENPVTKTLKQRLQDAGFVIDQPRGDRHIKPDAYRVSDKIAVEIEVTHKSRLHVDFDKFLELELMGDLAVGILIVPEDHLGREMANYRRHVLGDQKATHAVETMLEDILKLKQIILRHALRILAVGVDFPLQKFGEAS